MAGTKGNPGRGKRQRVQRSGPQERTPDLETAVEDEMLASGRHSVVPRTGLVGAHEQRNATMLDDDVSPPPGAGSDQAPTKKALERERERHRLQRDLGVAPAGEGTRMNQQHPAVPRQELDHAAGQADTALARRNINAEGESMALFARAVRWAGGNKRELKAAAIGALAVGGAAVAFTSFRRR